MDYKSLIDAELLRIEGEADALRTRNKELMERITFLEGELRRGAGERDLLYRQVEAYRMAAVMLNSDGMEQPEVENVRQQIRGMLRDINKCLALLNN